jgi:hypothetical protein
MSVTESDIERCLVYAPVKVERDSIRADVGAEDCFEFIVVDEPGVVPSSRKI